MPSAPGRPPRGVPQNDGMSARDRSRRTPAAGTVARTVRGLVGLVAVAVLAACGTTSPAATGGTATPAAPPPTTAGATTAGPTAAPSPTGPAVTAVTATTLAVRLPAPAARVVALPVADHLLLLGGLVAGSTSTQVLRLDPVAGTVAAAGHLVHATHDAGGAVLGGSALVLGGGVTASAAWVQAVPAGGGAGTVVGQLPQPRSDHVVVSDGTTAWVVGGYAAGPELTDVLATTDGRTFHVVAHLVTGVRYAAAALVGGALWVVGGEHGGTPVDLVQRVDLATGTATVVGHLPAPLSHASAVTLDGALLVVGGLRAGAPVDTVDRIDTATGTPTVVGHLPVAASDTAVAVLGGAAYVVGGTGAGGHALTSVVRLTTGPASPAP